MTNETHVKRPGLVLRDTFLRPLKIDLVTLHFLTNLPAHRLQEIVSGQRAIDRRDACCFGDTFGTGEPNSDWSCKRRMRTSSTRSEMHCHTTE